ncbi:MAG: tRNA (guanosine(37)-N1)-methyltransferase TrmD [Candidatus Omnitrophica bacterium]|nr:tRNA (guanosine(37)-N1)-methyltransferase TrmD [Candidatus Omnitrophota bacterium]MDD5670176.1 tRNA (guanosine(37)-N1)-methyltransferase TrmD [Candidatus Omnitrophota bacterium]
MSLQIDIITLFPSFFETPLQQSILKRAQKERYVKITVHNLRDYTHDRHKTVDAKPFGGGAGMLMKPEPLFECVEALQKRKASPGSTRNRANGWVVLLDPHGEPMTQAIVEKLARKRRLLLIAGHYEGVDHRVREHLVDQEISVGDFVTMGGEAPALCLIEAVTRLLPGVLGNCDSLKHESFHGGALEYPQYTRPREFRGWSVPDVLVSGHHREVESWREKAALAMTQKFRPDLLHPKG